MKKIKEKGKNGGRKEYGTRKMVLIIGFEDNGKTEDSDMWLGTAFSLRFHCSPSLMGKWHVKCSD